MPIPEVGERKRGQLPEAVTASEAKTLRVRAPRQIRPADAPFEFSYTQPSGDRCGSRIPARLKAGQCGVQLAFEGGQPFIRLCSKGNAKGHRIRVDSPREANELAKEACRDFAKHKNYRSFLARHKDRKMGLGEAKTSGKRMRLAGLPVHQARSTRGRDAERCRYGKITRGPRKGQCRTRPVRRRNR
jgi:hypothetical protein